MAKSKRGVSSRRSEASPALDSISTPDPAPEALRATEVPPVVERAVQGDTAVAPPPAAMVSQPPPPAARPLHAVGVPHGPVAGTEGARASGLLDVVVQLCATPIVLLLGALSIPASWLRGGAPTRRL